MADTHQRPGQGAAGPADITSLLAGRIGPSRTPDHGRPPVDPSVLPPVPVARPVAAAAPTHPASVPRLAGLPGELPVSWDVIESLQAEVSHNLTAEDPTRLLEDDDRRARARSLVNTAVANWATLYAQGNTPLTSDQERAIGDAVFNAMYRGGRLQSLLDQDGVEDIMVDGLTAHIEYYDQPRRTINKVSDSHTELIAWVNRMAGLSGHGERSLTQATPNVGFRMPDGSRVTASLLTTRPSVVIRKHRIREHGLDKLLEWGTINPLLRAFLIACVQAKLNLLVVGDMGAGKTSLLRALGREIPASERLVTLESDRELYLDEPGPPEKPGPLTFAFEARQSNGEVRGAGDQAGAISISEMYETALRYNASRVIVGEVRSKEILPMFEAMSSGGKSSMCTLHVRRPHAIISRLVQLCTNAGVQTEAAHHLIASSVDVVIYLTYLDETAIGGRKHRFVSHIYEVHDDVGEGGRPTTSELFAPQGDEPRAVYRNMPSFIDSLELTGSFYRHWLTGQQPETAWETPLQLVSR
ncbi:CpaF family protein [Streptomyces sp. ISL-43]|uniref:CpaF family protein n=1 Tax=Streptomyces sp. ISL-43 TaxID=2819183 RepID=UPI001BE54CB1|nr:CpaF/VirB11 family protein [Streptomyces sp. ISL-43]MBT2446055.1 CpaF family protein [Streptomyces sp. ISL-43]